MKYTYYVAIINRTDNHLMFVTEIMSQTKVAKWEDGKPAKKFTKTTADDLMFGLICNGYDAVVIKAAKHLELSNK